MNIMSSIAVEPQETPVMAPPRLDILGIAVDAVDMEGALAEVDRRIRVGSSPGYILAANPEKVYAIRRNPFLASFFREAALVIPDGIGVVLAMRWLHGRSISRVAGADLMQNICRISPQKGYRIFIYGASEEVNAGAVEQLSRRNPGIRIVGRANGYVPQAEMADLVEKINASNADILFIALGSPRQEEWLSRWLPHLQVMVCQGIGGTLDTIVGKVKRAPIGWQKLGLEWLYRLLHQPSRIFRQKVLARFAVEALAAKFRLP